MHQLFKITASIWTRNPTENWPPSLSYSVEFQAPLAREARSSECTNNLKPDALKSFLRGIMQISTDGFAQNGCPEHQIGLKA